MPLRWRPGWRAGLCRRVAGRADQTGSHTGQFPAAEQVAQVLTPGGAVVYSSGIEGTGPLLSPAQLRRVAGGPLTFTATIEGERLRAAGQ